MSGSANEVAVRLTPEQMARIERERERRRRLRDAQARATVATVASAGQATGAAARKVSGRRTAEGGTRRVANGSENSSRQRRALARAQAIAVEARAAGMDDLVEMANDPQIEQRIDQLERVLDDRLDARATERQVEQRLREVVGEVLGQGWEEQPVGAVTQMRSGAGDRAAHTVSGRADGTAVVSVVVDARSETINDRPALNCDDENRIAREILLGLASDGVTVTSVPKAGAPLALAVGALAGARVADAGRRREAPL